MLYKHHASNTYSIRESPQGIGNGMLVKSFIYRILLGSKHIFPLKIVINNIAHETLEAML